MEAMTHRNRWFIDGLPIKNGWIFPWRTGHGIQVPESHGIPWNPVGHLVAIDHRTCKKPRAASVHVLKGDDLKGDDLKGDLNVMKDRNSAELSGLYQK